MKFLTFNLIKAHLRIDDAQADMERELLEMYGDAAEQIVLQLLNRTLNNVVATYDGVPMPLKQAALLLVGSSYQHREPAGAQNMYAVPYAFDLLLKPYMRLAGTKADDGDILCDVYGDPILDANGKPIPLKPLDHDATAADVRLTMTAKELRMLLEGRNKNGVIDTVPEVMDALGGVDDDTELSLMGCEDADDMMDRVLGTTLIYNADARSVEFVGKQPVYDAATRSVTGVPAGRVHIMNQ